MPSKALKRPYKLFIKGGRTRTYQTRENLLEALLKLLEGYRPYSLMWGHYFVKA